jgi:hypothetical protein
MEFAVNTRINGAYILTNIPPGKYKLLALEGGALPNSIRSQLGEYEDLVETIAIHPGDRLTQDLRQHERR